MLATLQVHNFALIEDAEVEFLPGFNVFTGETGAGKSILIDAFSIALGARASVDYIRRGCDAFWVQAVFTIDNKPQIRDLLSEYAIDDEGELFLRRRIAANGKSQATVNGVQVPLNVLKAFGELLVDVHGQHENQALLKPAAPLNLTDLYYTEKIAPLLRKYSEYFSDYKLLLAEKARLEKSDENRTHLLERLQWEINEIEEAALQDGELEELQTENRIIQNNEKIVSSVNKAYDLLNGEYSILDAVSNAKDNIEAAAHFDPILTDKAEALESAWLQLDECRQDLMKYLENREFDAERAAYVEERLDLWYKLQNKYGLDYHKIMSYLNDNKIRATELENLEALINKTITELNNKTAQLQCLATELTALRKEAADKLTELLLLHLKDLGMPEAALEIHFFDTDSFTKTGKDLLEIYFSANCGEPLLPLTKVVSGGELSRIALAVKTVLFNANDVGTMVFDEIDTGVGGITAQKMAEKITLIAKTGQVICITHLPQIACFADQHIRITKETNNQRTHTLLQTLTLPERTEELMRMMAGASQTAAAKANAEELLSAAEKYKINR